MRWQQGRRSSNVEDRRGRRMPIGVGRRGAGLGCGGIALVLLVTWLLGGDPGQVLQVLVNEPGGGGTAPAPAGAPAAGDEAAQFVSVVLADTEDTWGDLFTAAGGRYRPPRLVLYEDAVQSACGFNSTATGPFYCPGDAKVYLDLGFMRELQRLGAPGDFAMAYVIAHEVGHHIQNLTGTEEEVRSLQQRAGQREGNALQVRMELQADCYAGVWAHHIHDQTNIVLEDGDVEEGLRAAAAIGDDRLQRMAGRRVQPEAFTHGSSAQRVEWFRRGLGSGDVGRCDTFRAGDL